MADVPLSVKFGTAGLGGVMGWICVHPFNVLAVRMNLASMQPGFDNASFLTFAKRNVAQKGVSSLYDGLTAGIVRQVFYATSRFGLFEVFRDQIEGFRGTVGPAERIAAGLASGACAALISCPAEVSLVRMANDSTLPAAERRNYTSVVNAGKRIAGEEGIAAFWRGSTPFVQRAMLVGVTQVGTLDQFKETYEATFGLQRGTYKNVFAASMSSGLLYSLITMPFESAKNRMAAQKPGPDGILPYRGTFQTMKAVAATDGVVSLWRGFLPYYGRCGGHTVTMFVFVEMLRKQYRAFSSSSSSSASY